MRKSASSTTKGLYGDDQPITCSHLGGDENQRESAGESEEESKWNNGALIKMRHETVLVDLRGGSLSRRETVSLLPPPATNPQ